MPGIGIINNIVTGPQEIGIRSVTTIPKGLCKEVFVNEPALDVTVSPVFGLTCTEPSQFNPGELCETTGKDRCEIIVGTIIETKFTAQFIYIEIPSSNVNVIRVFTRLYFLIACFLFYRVFIFPIIP